MKIPLLAHRTWALLLVLALLVALQPAGAFSSSFRPCSLATLLLERHHGLVSNTFCRPAKQWARPSFGLWGQADGHDKQENNRIEREASSEEPSEKDNKPKGVLLEEMDWETAEIEQRASNKVWFSLMAPYIIGKYIYYLVYALAIIVIVLGYNGYAFVWKDGHLAIGTLSERLFQDELARGLRESARNVSN